MPVPGDERGALEQFLELGLLALVVALVLGGIVGLWNLRLRSIVRHRTRELAEREAMYRLLAENDSDVTARHAPDGVYRYVSPAARQVLGYEPDALVGTNAFDLVHPDDVAALRQAYAEAVGSGPVVTTFRMRRADGTHVWVESAGRRVLGRGDELLEVQTSTRDVSKRHAAEEELRRREEQLSSLARTMPAAMWSADANGECTFITPRWEEMSGQPVEAALGTGWFDVIHPDDRAHVEAAWGADGEHGGEIRTEYRVVRPDGELRWLGEFGMPTRDDGPRALHRGHHPRRHRRPPGRRAAGSARRPAGRGGDARRARDRRRPLGAGAAAAGRRRRARDAAGAGGRDRDRRR